MNTEFDRTSEPLTETEISRRTFLAAAGGGVLAASLLKTAAAQNTAPGATRVIGPPPANGAPLPELQNELPTPSDERVGYAVVGLGNYALNQILPSFVNSKKSKLVALVSGNPTKAARIADAYGVKPEAIYNYANFERLRDNPEVQVVYIILPVGLHAEYSVRASNIGKHVLCEKPMAPTEAECRRMILAARGAGKKLMIAYRAQYEPFNLEAMRLARSGEFGPITSIVADHGRPVDPSKPSDAWRLKKALAGGGSLFDVGIYSLNATRYLTGEEPIEISAMMHSPAGDPRFAEVEETVHWTMRFPSGVLANCTTSYNYQETKRFRVLCEKGWFELDPATDYYRHNLRVEHPASEELKKQGFETIQEERPRPEGNQFAAQLDHFAECVQTGRDPKTPGEEGLRDVRLMLAIYEAARTGRVVKMPA